MPRKSEREGYALFFWRLIEEVLGEGDKKLEGNMLCCYFLFYFLIIKYILLKGSGLSFSISKC